MINWKTGDPQTQGKIAVFIVWPIVLVYLGLRGFPECGPLKFKTRRVSGKPELIGHPRCLEENVPLEEGSLQKIYNLSLTQDIC